MTVNTSVIEAVIAENAALLGEEPTIGVHCLRDGRVRIYDLDKGWRRRPWKEYSSLSRAEAAANKAYENARRVAEMVANGYDKYDAIRCVTEGYR